MSVRIGNADLLVPAVTIFLARRREGGKGDGALKGEALESLKHLDFSVPPAISL